MQKVSLIFLFLIANLYSIAGFSQTCFDYYKHACVAEPSKYTYNEKTSSVSFEFIAGQQRKIPFTIYAGKDYRITICAQEVFNDVIKFTIENEQGEVIYDNSEYNYLLNIEFSAKYSQNATILLEAPDVEVVDSLKPKGCIGVLIEDMVSVKTGF